jgi:hypothetical protein
MVKKALADYSGIHNISGFRTAGIEEIPAEYTGVPMQHIVASAEATS